MKHQNLGGNKMNKENLDNNTVEETKEAEVLTLTQEELQALLQKEGDKRVSSAQSKWEKEASKRVSEAEKLAKMDEESKAKYEFEQRVAELEAREKELTLSANRVECSRIMASKGLPEELVDFVVSEDADEMNDRIKLFERVIKDTVSKEVLSRIGDDAPKSGSGSSGAITKESFNQMSLTEQMALYERDPELYNKLTR